MILKFRILSVLAGKTLDILASGEHLAEPGQVVVHQKIMKRYTDLITVSEERSDEESGQLFGVVKNLNKTITPEPWIESEKGRADR